MSNWGDFEDKCYKFLCHKYGTSSVRFESVGKSDSGAPDVKVYLHSKHVFNIEIKMASAQCGQFVLFPNEVTRSFEYSKGNAYPLNPDSQTIMDYMAQYFESFRDAGSAGKLINIGEATLYSWIRNYYKKKGVRFFITENAKGFILVPIEKFENYFSVSATYRMKKSGSTDPSPSNYQEIKQLINAPSTLKVAGGKIIVTTSQNLTDKKIAGQNYTYLFRHAGTNQYIVKRLSNTTNSNVIFSIQLKADQDSNDLFEFLKSIQ